MLVFPCCCVYVYVCQRLSEGLNGPAPKEPKRKGVADYFDQSSGLSVSKGHWQVVEVREGREPGHFVLWAFTSERQMQVRGGACVRGVTCLRVCVSACLRVCVSACLRVCVSACLHVRVGVCAKGGVVALGWL
jgi:hypothetical protein